jgi:predicted amidohydrolase YtcJ
MEGRKGLIRPGYLADIVILDRDLFAVSEEEIMKTRVDLTITGGKVVFESGK